TLLVSARTTATGRSETVAYRPDAAGQPLPLKAKYVACDKFKSAMSGALSGFMWWFSRAASMQRPRVCCASRIWYEY
ncbi:hypothetical protein, partial [Comamonas testosteroni]|uniref:hypothetical protein n=1 Tax=Comamonas testosteroni TaxID=285 RepID=UPI001E508825